jgi:ribosome-associated translation inhibitor RaiA
LKVRAKGFRSTEAIESFCHDNYRQAIAGYTRDRLGRFDIALEQENSPTKRGRDLYLVRVRSSGSSWSIVKQHTNLYGAIEIAFDALRRKLGRESKRIRDRFRRRQDRRNRPVTSP